MSIPSASPDNRRHRQLDGLRGFAAVAVVLFHAMLVCDESLNGRIIRPPLAEAQAPADIGAKLVFMLLSGETAVTLFFVLSGAVLFESLQRRYTTLGRTLVSFSLRRVLRLYPVFFVALVAAAAAHAAVGDVAARIPLFWRNALLADFGVLGVSWTLQVEFLAIPFLVAAFAAFNRWGALAVPLVCGAFVLPLSLLGTPEQLVHFVRFLPCFALGFLVPMPVAARLVRVLPKGAWIAVLAALLSIRHVIELHWWTMTLSQCFAALLIAQLRHDGAGALGRLCATRAAQWLGRVSYGVYLWNVVFLVLVHQLVQRWSFSHAHPVAAGLVVGLVVLAPSLCTAHYSERYLERPLQGLARRPFAA